VVHRDGPTAERLSCRVTRWRLAPWFIGCGASHPHHTCRYARGDGEVGNVTGHHGACPMIAPCPDPGTRDDDDTGS